jgi:histidinol-phosphatase
MSQLSQDLEFAFSLADAARRISLKHFRQPIEKWSKADGSLATAADLAVEDALRALIAAERPGDAMLGEERGQTGASSRRWIVDAIDGTVDFSTGGPDWGTLIALEIEGRVVVGVCDQPVHARRYWAAKGTGAWCLPPAAATPVKLSVTNARDLATARAYVPPPTWTPERFLTTADALRAATKAEMHTDHPALELAAGGFDVVVFFSGGPWDLAAPALVVEEAGGRFSDLSGRHDLFSGGGVFTNGLLHDDAIRVMR